MTGTTVPMLAAKAVDARRHRTSAIFRSFMTRRIVCQQRASRNDGYRGFYLFLHWEKALFRYNIPRPLKSGRGEIRSLTSCFLFFRLKDLEGKNRKQLVRLRISPLPLFNGRGMLYLKRACSQ